MVSKRKQSTFESRKSGFSVGPANLPDGTYKRKNDRIKQDLIHKAKIRKEFAKVKARHAAENPTPAARLIEDEDPQHIQEPVSLELHPDRQAQLDKPESPEPTREPAFKRQRRPKHDPFSKEAETARRRKEAADQRRKERAEADAQREQAIQDRERIRKAMIKAKTPGRDGKRKLGRESNVLLEKVKKMVANG